VLPWVCRVRGCKWYGHNFRKRAKLQSHLERCVHEVLYVNHIPLVLSGLTPCRQSIIAKPVEVDSDEESDNEVCSPPRLVRFDPPPPRAPTNSLWDLEPDVFMTSPSSPTPRDSTL